jgi:hypothetical protein
VVGEQLGNGVGIGGVGRAGGAGGGQPMMLVDHRAERRARGLFPQPTGAGGGDAPVQPASGEDGSFGTGPGVWARTAA